MSDAQLAMCSYRPDFAVWLILTVKHTASQQGNVLPAIWDSTSLTETVSLVMIKTVRLILIALPLQLEHVLDVQRIFILEVMEHALQLILSVKHSIKRTETAYLVINPTPSATEPASLILMHPMKNVPPGSKEFALHVHPVPLWTTPANAKKSASTAIPTALQLETAPAATQATRFPKENAKSPQLKLAAPNTILAVNAPNAVKEAISAVAHASLSTPNALPSISHP